MCVRLSLLDAAFQEAEAAEKQSFQIFVQAPGKSPITVTIDRGTAVGELQDDVQEKTGICSPRLRFAGKDLRVIRLTVIANFGQNMQDKKTSRTKRHPGQKDSEHG